MDDKKDNNANVVKLALATAPHSSSKVPNQNIIKMLEDLVEEAKIGEIQGIAVGIWTNENAARSAFDVGDNYFEMLGVVNWLRSRLDAVIAE